MEEIYESVKRLFAFDPEAAQFERIVAGEADRDEPRKAYPDIMETTLPTAEVEIPVVQTLTAADRCDRCGAQAYTRAKKDSLEILFCAHHTRENHEALLAKGFTVHTEVVPG